MGMEELFPPRKQKQTDPAESLNDTLSTMAQVGWGLPTPETGTEKALRAEVQKLKQALLEIGVAAADALMAEGIEHFDEGGPLGNALIYVKDSVDDAIRS